MKSKFPYGRRTYALQSVSDVTQIYPLCGLDRAPSHITHANKPESSIVARRPNDRADFVCRNTYSPNYLAQVLDWYIQPRD